MPIAFLAVTRISYHLPISAVLSLPASQLTPERVYDALLRQSFLESLHKDIDESFPGRAAGAVLPPVDELLTLVRVRSAYGSFSYRVSSFWIACSISLKPASPAAVIGLM
jgi:hypothetical protein